METTIIVTISIAPRPECNPDIDKPRTDTTQSDDEKKSQTYGTNYRMCQTHSQSAKSTCY